MQGEANIRSVLLPRANFIIQTGGSIVNKVKASKTKARYHQLIKERNEALLSMDRAKILAFAKKHSGDIGLDRADEYIFWISVHKARTASLGLPEFERRKSMKWLTERGFEHFASDLDEKDKLTGSFIFRIASTEN